MTEPALDEEQLQRFRSAYWRAAHQLDAIRLRQWEESHLTLPQLRVLHEVRRSPGITAGELARVMGVTMSTSSGLVLKLVARGLIERSRDQNDRRHAPLRLTEGGQSVVGELAEAGRAFLREVAEQLNLDLWGVTVALERLTEAASEIRADTAPSLRAGRGAA